jgi:predicted methyltransferase
MRLTDTDRSLWSLLALGFALMLVVAPIAACAQGADEAGGEDAAGEAQGEGAAMEHGEATGMEHDEGAAADAAEGLDHVHSAGGDTPSRADEEERDQYSKPLDVFAFAGIGEGDTVVDVGAGSGYNTYLVSDLVGDAGMVYALGGNEGLVARLEHGDMAGATNVLIPENAAAIPDGAADAVLLVREFHLAPDHMGYLASVHRMLKPSGVVAVIEVRSGQPEGYDHEAHRSGEQSVIAEFVAGGFELVAESDILRRDDDDYAVYGGPTGMRYITDRMLLRFRKTQ